PLVRRAGAVLDLAAELEPVVARVHGTSLMRDVELPLPAVLATMERAGIAADREYLTDLELGFAAGVKHATEDAHAAAGRPFNLGSPKQLQEILFVELGLPKTKRI